MVNDTLLRLYSHGGTLHGGRLTGHDSEKCWMKITDFYHRT